MRLNSLISRATIIGIALIVGLAVGSVSVNHVIASTSDNQNKESAIVYKVNDHGQTYGSSMKCTSQDQEPDLVQATGIDGIDGYVFSKDLNEDLAKSLEEAVALQKSRGTSRIIPLYDVTGEKVVGKFEISGTLEYMEDKN
jgi:hypothetical protein